MAPSPKQVPQKASVDQQRKPLPVNLSKAESTPQQAQTSAKKKKQEAITISKLQETEALLEDGDLEIEANKTAEEVV